jgi:hypothetical protein
MFGLWIAVSINVIPLSNLPINPVAGRLTEPDGGKLRLENYFEREGISTAISLTRRRTVW